MDDSQKAELTLLLQSEKPNLKSTSIAQYVRTLNTLYKNYTKRTQLPTDDKDYIKDGGFENEMDLFKDPKMVSILLSDYHFTSARNFYTSIITILETEEKRDKKVILQYQDIVKKNNEEYNIQNKSGIISEKQAESFNVGVDKFDELLRKLKKDKLDMAFIIFSILKHHHIRNEIATLIYITLPKYNKLKTIDKFYYEDDDVEKINKIGKNYLVVGTKKIFISRNGYKTGKIYGQIIFDITDKPLIKEIRKYVKVLKDDEVFPFPDSSKSDKKQQLASYLGYYSKKYIGVKLSTTIIAKIMNSHNHLEAKELIEKDASERGHSSKTLLDIYVKKSNAELETNPTDTKNKG
tara:strand:- start:1358 stop:2407 length:1050 start_codon:yes stop_codon:yes gene_type:complete